MTALGTSKGLAAASVHGVGWLWGLARGRIVKAVGGPARARVIVLFGGVLALSTAQISTVGAVAPQLEASLHIGNTKIGLLNSVALVVGAVAVIPVGLLVDRAKRIPMLSISIVLWSVTTMLGAIASSYEALLLSRVALGAVSATAGPAIASLTGDYFPSRERGHVYGYILTGEIAGTAIGFVISGNVASALSWRVSFWLLAIAGLFLARSLWRTVPEPMRGGHSRLRRGARDLANPNRNVREGEPTEEAWASQPQEQDLAYKLASRQGYRPDPAHVLRRDPDTMSLKDAIVYILSIPTNVMLIISSSLGYFFLSGLETFAVVFVRGHFHVSQAKATLVLGVLVIGAVVGTLLSGPLTDLLTRHGKLGARVWVPAVCNLVAAAVLIPGILAGTIGSSIWFYFIGTALISAANPPLDAARLDIMPSGLWGRAESVRTFLRSLAQAVAPLAFGAVADLVAGFQPPQAPIGTSSGQIVSASSGTGLQVSFLVMLISLAAAGWFLLRGRRSYPRDVATAAVAWTPRPRGGPAPPDAFGASGGDGPDGSGSPGGDTGGAARSPGDGGRAKSRSGDDLATAAVTEPRPASGPAGDPAGAAVTEPLPASDTDASAGTERLVWPRQPPGPP